MSTPPTLQLEYGTLYQSQSLGQKKNNYPTAKLMSSVSMYIHRVVSNRLSTGTYSPSALPFHYYSLLLGLFFTRATLYM